MTYDNTVYKYNMLIIYTTQNTLHLHCPVLLEYKHNMMINYTTQNALHLHCPELLEQSRYLPTILLLRMSSPSPLA
jgi:hypothetical protein